MRSGKAIRQEFVDFFVQRYGHTFVPPSSVVPLDDPTLLFTNAGMNQFKDVFLGTGSRPYRRAVNYQKCIRAGGKHNDLDDVGRDTYHHTFFEMLGNWSFGDYFKKEAIQWAWELLTQVWGLDKSRLHATVFAGDAEQGLERDEEAYELWRTVTDIDPSHIHWGGKKDNFWEMGDTGPCGPCTEIHIDRTPDKQGGRLINRGAAEVIEIWNLVFIQFNRGADQRLRPLPARHVDTGMGFERITAILQGKSSNYDTDIFLPLLKALGELVSARYTGRLDDPKDIAFRVIADHVRMLTFALTDGALPGNKGRGAVLRGVLRRAFRFGYQVFGQRAPFLYQLVPVVVEQLADAYPELRSQPARVQEIIREEEADFLRTIERGLRLFQRAAEEAARSDGVLRGSVIFDLHTTYGFYPDLVQQMASEQGLRLDWEGYQRLWEEHVRLSESGSSAAPALSGVAANLPATDDRLKWYGRQAEATLLGWLADNQYHTQGQVPAGQVGLVLDRTCFYAEQGGQVGDQGVIRAPSGCFEVMQTVKVGNTVVHWGRLVEGCLQVGQVVHLEVSPEREFTRKNHTATHLLHWALGVVLGPHVEQRGSRVKPDSFTFDFSHTGPLTEAEKAEIERLVNEKVYADLPVHWRELPLAEARQLPGVKAFFGDKYGDIVRVVEIGDGFSREFCGGTHLEHTGQIGFFKIVKEEAVGKGVRRLTCVTAREAVRYVQQEEAILSTLASRCRCQPEELPARVETLQEEIKKLQQQLKKGAVADLQTAADRLLAQARQVGNSKLIIGQMPAGPIEQLRHQADRLRQKAGSAVVVFGWTEDGKALLLAAVTRDLEARGVHAGQLLKQLAPVIGGGGGGPASLAQAGGKEAGKLAEALALAEQLLQQQLTSAAPPGETAAS
jgi:alanyl-tRNA synthetase